MQTRLPGEDPANSVGLGILKAVLRLAGGEALADAIGDLTGLGRTTVEGLARRALETTASLRANEFGRLADADREWAESVLVASYCRLASLPDPALARESLVGSESLAALAFGAGMEASDRDELEGATEDVRSYFQLISRSMATVVSQWYMSDQRASQPAVAAAVGAVLATVREVLARMDSLESVEAARALDPTPQTLARLLRSELEELSRVPEYYPDVFNNVILAGSLHVAELGDHDFTRFEGRGLYWEGRLSGERLALTPDDIRPNSLTVLLGNPGSGKSTMAKALVASEIRKGRTALYCRLEDFSRICSKMPDDPGTAAVVAAAQAAGTQIDVAVSARISTSWDTRQHPLIVLDGLDELATASDYAVARRAAARLSEMGHPVLVTSRVAGYTVPWTGVHRHLAIWPLDTEARDAFSDSWFTSTEDEAARHRFAVAAAEASLDEVLTSPLTLGFVCRLAHYGDVPISTGAVFSHFIDHFLRAPWRDPAVQRVNIAQIGQLKRAAERVAWAMADHGKRTDTVWLDVVELDTIGRITGDEAAYETYATGLLIPHGPVEPLGGTQQRARWLHRALQENLVAQRILTLVETDQSDWRDLLLRTSFSAAWQGALDQAFMLLGERSGLQAVLRYFEEQMQIGDTPERHLAGMLCRASVHSGCVDDRQHAAHVLVAAGDWERAALADAHVALAELRRYIRTGRTPDSEYVWVRMYQAGVAGADDLLLEAAGAVRGAATRELATAAAWIRLGKGNRKLRQSIVAELCTAQDWPLLWFLRPLEEPARTEAVTALAECLRDPDPHARPGLGRAHHIWEAIVGPGAAQVEVPTDPDLQLAVLVGRKAQNIDRDLRDIHHLIVRPVANEDLWCVAVPLQRHGLTVDVQDRDYLAYASREYDLSGIDEAGPPNGFHLTEHSTFLAEAIIQHYGKQTAMSPSANQLESLRWALEVLRQRPHADAITPLMRLREQDWVQRRVDANFLQSVLTRQPWDALAAQVIENPTANPAWDAQVLIWAANFADGPHRTIELGRVKKVEYYVEGLKRWVLGGMVAPSPRDIGYLEVLDRPNAEHLVATLTAFVGQGELPTRRAVLAQVERSLVATGLLAIFFDQLRIYTDFRC